MRSDDRTAAAPVALDERSRAALDALAASREAFRSAVAQAVDEVRSLLDRERARRQGGAERQAAELGAFVAGRLDAALLASLLGEDEAIDAPGLRVLERGLAILEAIAGWGADGFLVRVDAGHDLRGAVGAGLALAGRAFGAATAVELVRSGRFRPDEHDALLGPFPPDRWNDAERRIAPPLVVELHGGDLRAGGLAEFLDGTQKIVLVVRSPAPAAALVRLITPGVLVAQVSDAAELAALLSYDGPAIVALVPEGAARFVHDPRGGATLAARLTIASLPQREPRGRIGGLSRYQRTEELLQLAALTELAAATGSGPGAGAAHVSAADGADGASPLAAAPSTTPAPQAQPADRLAAWLLRQADLTDV